MTAVDLIERKRDGQALSVDELGWLIEEYTAHRMPDYQMAAFLMAVFFSGMTPEELAAWTRAMLHSGETLDLSGITAPKVDKHSTGGVGDKVSICLAPMVAACGVAVPMISGRGLGHTGGTLDKLESIPGFTVALEGDRFASILEAEGLVLAGQSETLVPADRRIYALRDATATVPSIPLIASSIMSKKLAEDLDGLVLDVKVGRGAFMRDETQAPLLAETMVGIGAAYDTPVVALLTNMDQPLGREVGNANEVREALEILEGDGPDDLAEITYRLGEEMLLLAGVAADQEDARRRLMAAVDGGHAREKFAAVIEAQGGDPGIVEAPELLPAAGTVEEFPAERSGYVTECDARTIGVAAMRLGAGRERKEDDVDHGVGITVLAKLGDRVEEGQPLCRVAWSDSSRRDAARQLLERAWVVSDAPGFPRPLVLLEVGK